MTGPLRCIRRYRRMRAALLLIGTRCTSSTGPSTCVDDPTRSPDAATAPTAGATPASPARASANPPLDP